MIKIITTAKKVIYTQGVIPKDTRPMVDGLPGVSDGRAKKVAKLISLLAYDRTAYITGQNIRLDGDIIHAV